MTGARAILVAVLLLPAHLAAVPEVTVDAHNGRWVHRHWWTLFMAKGGRATLIGPRDTGGTREFRVPPEDRRQLVAVVRAEALFELRDAYGNTAIDAPMCGFSVRLAGAKKSILIGRFDDDPPTAAERAELDRAFRVWDAIKRIAGISDVPDVCR